MRKILSLKSQKGFSLVEILVSVGMIAMLMGGVATYVKVTADTKRKIDMGLNLANFKESVIRNLNSPGAWNMTISKNSNLACLNTSSPGCTNGATGAIAVYDISGELLTSSGASAGFDRAGKPCTSFNGVSGDTACVFHYNIQWTALCSFMPCKDPQIRIDGTLTYSPADPKLREGFNASRYNFSFFRAETIPNSLEAVCVSLGGIFNSGTNSCQFPWANYSCPPGQVLRGLNAANVPNCYYPVSYTCPAGQLLRAIMADGTPVCANLVCSGWAAPTGWIEEPPGLSYTDWFSSGGGDGGCDGADGGCGS